MACDAWTGSLPGVPVSGLGDGRYCLSGYTQTIAALVSRHLALVSQKNGASAVSVQQILGLGSYRTAGTWLHKLRRLSWFVLAEIACTGGLRWMRHKSGEKRQVQTDFDRDEKCWW